jgi:HTTM domain
VSALTCARVGIGLSAIVKAIQMWPMLHRLVADPRIVQMPLFPWPRPSTFVMTCIVVAWAGLGAAVAAGIAVRVTGALLAASIGYVVTLDQQTYSSHVYLLALASGLLAVAHTKSGREPAVALLRWQLVIVYAFAAASKINPVFLSGLVIAANLRPVFQGIRSFPLMMSLAVATVAAEGFVAWSLLRPKWRTAGAAIGVVLHIGFVVMITETVAMIVFAMICLSMYPLFWLPKPPSAN